MKTKRRIFAEAAADIALMALLLWAISPKFPTAPVSELATDATILKRVLAPIITRIEPLMAAPKPLLSEPTSILMIAAGFAFAALCFALAFRPGRWLTSFRNKEVSQ